MSERRSDRFEAFFTFVLHICVVSVRKNGQQRSGRSAQRTRRMGKLSMKNQTKLLLRITIREMSFHLSRRRMRKAVADTEVIRSFVRSVSVWLCRSAHICVAHSFSFQSKCEFSAPIAASNLPIVLISVRPLPSQPFDPNGEFTSFGAAEYVDTKTKILFRFDCWFCQRISSIMPTAHTHTHTRTAKTLRFVWTSESDHRHRIFHARISSNNCLFIFQHFCN